MNLISGRFVVPTSTPTPPEMEFIGHREGFQKSSKPPNLAHPQDEFQDDLDTHFLLFWSDNALSRPFLSRF